MHSKEDSYCNSQSCDNSAVCLPQTTVTINPLS